MNVVIDIPQSIVDSAMKQIAQRADGCTLSPAVKKRMITKAITHAIEKNPRFVSDALTSMNNQEFYTAAAEVEI